MSHVWTWPDGEVTFRQYPHKAVVWLIIGLQFCELDNSFYGS